MPERMGGKSVQRREAQECWIGGLLGACLQEVPLKLGHKEVNDRCTGLQDVVSGL